MAEEDNGLQQAYDSVGSDVVLQAESSRVPRAVQRRGQSSQVAEEETAQQAIRPDGRTVSGRSAERAGSAEPAYRVIDSGGRKKRRPQQAYDSWQDAGTQAE